jgi:hypothetical protein
MPVKTRFATNYIMNDCLLQLCDTLKRMVVDADWFTLMEYLRRKYMKSALWCTALHSDDFWHTCKNFLYILILTLKALCVFDNKALIKGLAWKVIYGNEQQICRFHWPPSI